MLEAIKRKKEFEKEVEVERIISTSSKDINNLSFLEAVDIYVQARFEKEALGQLDINTIYEGIHRLEADIIPYFKSYQLKDITTTEVEKFLSYLRSRPKKNSETGTISEQTVYNIYSVLRTFFNVLKEDKKLISYNPVDDITNKPNPKRKKKELKYFKLEDAIYALRCLDRFADIRLKAYMSCIFSLGCRREEVTGLRWCDIDFKTNEVEFNFAVTSSVPKKYVKERVRTKELKNDHSYRTNILSTKAIEYLKRYYNFKKNAGFEINKDDYIFTNWDCTKPVDPNKMTSYWKDFKKLYGIKDVDLHRIRHTVANILEKRGIPKKDIAKLLGNTEKVLEEYYTHVDYEDLRKMRDVLDDSLFNELDCINVDIDFVAKVVNEYPLESMTDLQLEYLDYLSDEKVDDNNYINNIKKVKEIILSNDSAFAFFIEENNNYLDIKIDTYKKFSSNIDIKLKRRKDILINKDVFSF